MKGRKIAFVGAGVFIFSGGLSAHHGASRLHDLDQTVEVTGTVTDFQFVNPHVLIYFDVAAADGTVVEWSAGLTSRNRLARSDGWNGETLKAGDQITITGSPARTGAPSLWTGQIFLGGKPLLITPGGAG